MATFDPRDINPCGEISIADYAIPRYISFDEAEKMRNTMHFNVGSVEMVRISEDGFWVRGVKVEQDDNEAKRVYSAFKEWLVWSKLNER